MYLTRNGKAPITILLEPNFKRKFLTICHQEGINPNAITRKLLENFVKAKEIENDNNRTTTKI
jgi:hypothetical protein